MDRYFELAQIQHLEPRANIGALADRVGRIELLLDRIELVLDRVVR